jgi:hypothetical protein
MITDLRGRLQGSNYNNVIEKYTADSPIKPNMTTDGANGKFY